MAVRLAMPDSVRRLPVDDPEAAAAELAAILAEAPGRTERLAGDLLPMAAEAVEHALTTGAIFLAVVPTPGSTAPAVLTGVPVGAPSGNRQDRADALRDALENVGGPDVRETVTLDTAVGPVAVAQRMPGPEQQRAGRPLTLQLQAFIPEPGTGAMLLLTLASTTGNGWSEHQALFARMVGSAHTDELPPRTAPPPARSGPLDDEESFEYRSYIR